MKNKLQTLITVFSLLLGCTFTMQAETTGIEKITEQLARLDAYYKWSNQAESKADANQQDKIRQAVVAAMKSILDDLQSSPLNQADENKLAKSMNKAYKTTSTEAQMANTKILNEVKWDQVGGENKVLDDIKKLEDAIKDELKRMTVRFKPPLNP